MSRWLGLLVLSLSLWPTAASAYVRTTSDASGKALSWPIRCVVVQPDLRGSQDILIADVNTTLARAAGNWTIKTTTCSDLLLTTINATHDADLAPDGQPIIVFRDTAWDHDLAIIALTTVFYVDTPGKVGDATIFDADTELNGVNYTFVREPTNANPRPNTSIADLENTLTHELGHTQGLAHTCWDHIAPEPPLDNMGQPIPDCQSTLPASITDTTMYPYSSAPGETSKRNISADDELGICDSYPPTAHPPACFNQINGGGCAMVPRDGSSVVTRTLISLVTILTLLALAYRAHRRRVV